MIVIESIFTRRMNALESSYSHGLYDLPVGTLNHSHLRYFMQIDHMKSGYYVVMNDNKSIKAIIKTKDHRYEFHIVYTNSGTLANFKNLMKSFEVADKTEEYVHD